MNEPTAIELLVYALRERGYNGLCYPEEECGCLIDDLAPCGAGPSMCIAGVKRIKDDGDWEVVICE